MEAMGLSMGPSGAGVGWEGGRGVGGEGGGLPCHMLR